MKHPPHEGIHFYENIKIGDNVTIDIEPGAELIIEKNVKITGYCFLAASKNIYIGESTLIAEFVSLRDSNHGMISGVKITEQPLKSRGVYIGSDVWLGRGCAVLKGSHISNGSVIGANAVVTSSIPENHIAVGAPARPIKVRP